MEIDEKEFKKALSNLPAKEKDKLVLRLMRKDNTLKQSYYFKLVETRSLEELRAEMATKICDDLAYLLDEAYIAYLHMNIRYLSGDINHYLKVTKDKYGEVSLNILFLTVLLPGACPLINESRHSKHDIKFLNYIINRVYKVLCSMQKIHPDWHLDFQEDLAKIANHIIETPRLAQRAIAGGLEFDWLLNLEIPDNIIDFYSLVRKQGVLK